MIKKVIENMRRRKVEQTELVNLLANLGEDYFKLTDNLWKEKFGPDSVMSVKYWGKVLINPEEKGLKIDLDLYAKVTYQSYDEHLGQNTYPKKKYKIKSLEGFIEYPKLRLK